MVTQLFKPTRGHEAQAIARSVSFRRRKCSPRQGGALATELVVAIAILALALVPLSFGYLQETHLCRIYYNEAVAMGIVDGEMEILAAGEWRAFNEGQHNYLVRAEAAKNLPAGRFVLTRTNKLARLEWRPDQPGNGRPVAREWRSP